LGCGTGALAVLLAKEGFTVTAIDISSTAIAEAQKQAALRGEEIDFQVGDVCRLEIPSNSFDLITDNHFSHCIVFEEERRTVFGSIHRLLKPGGQFWIESMVGHPQMDPPDDWNLDSDGITWCMVDEEKAVEGCERRDGKVWYPVRRIRSTSNVLADEIRSAGLTIDWQETTPPIDENDTGTFRARCCK
jgi:SAM-dependent methyltransferase